MAGSRNPLRTYLALKRGVSSALSAGIDRAESARVETYWNTGRMIRDHLQFHADRAKYGQELFTRLEADTGVGQRLLYRCARFARCYLKMPILSARTKLTWAHYRVLIEIENAAERARLTAQAVREKWTTAELETHIRTLPNPDPNTPPAPTPEPDPLLKPKRGTIGVFQYLPQGPIAKFPPDPPEQPPGPQVDLGFTNYIKVRQKWPNKRRVVFAGRNHARPAPNSTRADLFTYRARVLRVIDGDTIWFEIQLRRGHLLQEKIRLRGIDCPELRTPEGRAAKKFVESQLAQAQSITITTTKPDKYDRYLCDIFLRTAAKTEIYLNNALLEAGHATRKTDWNPNDWL